MDLISCELVDIPIAGGSGTAKNNKAQSRWRQLKGKGKNEGSRAKLFQEYSRRKKVLERGKTFVSKKS